MTCSSEMMRCLKCKSNDLVITNSPRIGLLETDGDLVNLNLIVEKASDVTCRSCDFCWTVIDEVKVLNATLVTLTHLPSSVTTIKPDRP